MAGACDEICRDVWQGTMPILLCQWHVSRAWGEHLTSLPGHVDRKEFVAALRDIMHYQPKADVFTARGDVDVEVCELIQSVWDRFEAGDTWRQYFDRKWVRELRPGESVRCHTKLKTRRGPSCTQRPHSLPALLL